MKGRYWILIGAAAVFGCSLRVEQKEGMVFHASAGYEYLSLMKDGTFRIQIAPGQREGTYQASDGILRLAYADTTGAKDFPIEFVRTANQDSIVATTGSYKMKIHEARLFRGLLDRGPQ